MPKAVQTLTTSRRALFSAAPAFLLARPQAASSPHPDAALLGLCSAFMQRHARYVAIYEGPEMSDEAAEAAALPIIADMNDLLDRMAPLHAATPDGIHARAASLAAHNDHRDYSFDHPESMTGRLLGYLLRDAAMLPGSLAA